MCRYFSEIHEELTMALIDSNIILNLQRLLNQVGSCLFNPVFTCLHTLLTRLFSTP